MRAAKSQSRAGDEAAAGRRPKRERADRLAELLAAAFLVSKGYRILGRRVRARLGENDLIAVRGRQLAFVEEKYRDDATDSAMTVNRRQSDRIARAAEQWVWSHPAYRVRSRYRLGLALALAASSERRSPADLMPRPLKSST
jgi:putative endonuclease